MARIFNTFGPRMHMNDGRVVSNFILQALQNESITVSYSFIWIIGNHIRKKYGLIFQILYKKVLGNYLGLFM